MAKQISSKKIVSQVGNKTCKILVMKNFENGYQH